MNAKVTLNFRSRNKPNLIQRYKLELRSRKL